MHCKPCMECTHTDTIWPSGLTNSLLRYFAAALKCQEPAILQRTRHITIQRNMILSMFLLELPNHNSLLGFFAKLWVVCDLIVFCTFCQAKCWPLMLAFFIRAVRKLILIDWLNYWKCVFKPTRPKSFFSFLYVAYHKETSPQNTSVLWLTYFDEGLQTTLGNVCQLDISFR